MSCRIPCRLHIYQLTGDTRETASQVSGVLGISVLSARSLPHEKKAWVKSLQEKGDTVAMVFDYLKLSAYPSER
jgi:P-type E1-E2 ATPase